MSGALDILTLADLVRSQARSRPEKPAVVFGERTATFAALDQRSNRVAHALIADGVRPGTRVAMLDRDSDRIYEAMFGCAKARAVQLGLNWRLAPPEISFILEDSEAEVLFVGAEFAAKVAPLLPALPRLRRIIALTGVHGDWPAFDAWRDAKPGHDPGLAADPEETAVQMYTSGTTGRPKGVMLANRSFFAVVRSMKSVGDPWIGWGPEDVFLSGLPTFHIGGIWWAMTGFSAGATAVVIDAFAAWNVLELIPRHRVTKLMLVPSMIQIALGEPEIARTDFRSLTHIVYGGSPIPRPVLEQALRVFRCGFAQIYGLTETGNTAVCLRPEDHLRSDRPELLQAAGRPYPGVRLKIIDPAGRALGLREVGEICIHSPANMLGYWKRPDATAATLVDGWIHTGDAGSLDEEGFVFVCDRVKDMIISAGEKIFGAEVESALCGHPAVLEAAVIGVPDERWGEQVKAMVVLRPGHQATSAELSAFCRRQLADFKVPRSVEFVDALPRTPSGKIQKAILREPFWRGRERRV